MNAALDAAITTVPRLFIADWMTIYESDGAELHPVTQDGEDTGDIGLPKSNAYANEIRYFADCVKSGVFPDKVKPEELETVIDILKAI